MRVYSTGWQQWSTCQTAAPPWIPSRRWLSPRVALSLSSSHPLLSGSFLPSCYDANRKLAETAKKVSPRHCQQNGQNGKIMRAREPIGNTWWGSSEKSHHMTSWVVLASFALSFLSKSCAVVMSLSKPEVPLVVEYIVRNSSFEMFLKLLHVCENNYTKWFMCSAHANTQSGFVICTDFLFYIEDISWASRWVYGVCKFSIWSFSLFGF